MKRMKYLILAISMIALFMLASCTSSAPTQSPVEIVTTQVPAVIAVTTVNTETLPSTSYKDGTYQIDGKFITLLDGLSEMEAAPGSASKIITRYFGNEAFGDLNADGVDDVAFLLTQDGGGSGTFYYVVAALGSDSGYQGTNAVFLGDRIAPQNTSIENGMIIVNYADRKPDESFDVQPSVGVSKHLKIVDGLLTPEE